MSLPTSWSRIPVDWLVLCLDLLPLAELAHHDVASVSHVFHDAIANLSLQPISTGWSWCSKELPDGHVLAPAPIFVSHVTTVQLNHLMMDWRFVEPSQCLIHLQALRALPNLQSVVLETRFLHFLDYVDQILIDQSWAQAAAGGVLENVTLSSPECSSHLHAIAKLPSVTSIQLKYESPLDLEPLACMHWLRHISITNYPPRPYRFINVQVSSVNLQHVAHVESIEITILDQLQVLAQLATQSRQWKKLVLNIEKVTMASNWAESVGLISPMLPELSMLELDFTDSYFDTECVYPPWLHTLPNLHTLILRNVNHGRVLVDEDGDVQNDDFPKLNLLNLWGATKQLTTLVLDRCSIADLSSLSQCLPNLQSLTLDKCEFTQDSDDLHDAIYSSFPNLQFLNTEWATRDQLHAIQRACRARRPTVHCSWDLVDDSVVYTWPASSFNVQ